MQIPKTTHIKLNFGLLLAQIFIIMLSVSFMSFMATPVFAQNTKEVTCPNGDKVTVPRSVPNEDACPGARAVSPAGTLDADCTNGLDPKQCGIMAYLILFIRGLSAIVGVAIVAMFIVGGIQYSASQGNPNAITAATKRISGALIALVAYLFIFALLQWLVPGGVF